jgi:hypothetical protein
MSGMQRLYDSEINFVIEAFSDAGFYVTRFDEWNGFQTESRCSTWGYVGRGTPAMARISGGEPPPGPVAQVTIQQPAPGPGPAAPADPVQRHI